jgi:hypothetical protein
VHATKTAARPVVTAATGGVGNPIVSLLEDVVATILSILAIVLPIVMAILLGIVIALLARWWLRRKLATA